MLEAVYKTGSSVILPNNNDVDYIYIYTTYEEKMQALKHNRRRDVDNHYTYLERATKVFLGCYVYPFMKLVRGREIEAIKNFSIFDVKEKYIEKLKYFANIFEKTDKRWYHIYIAVRMFDKKKMTLTKKEKDIAQKIHDEGIDDETYQYIIDYLEK